MKTKLKFKENELELIWEYVKDVADEIVDQHEIFLIIKLMFIQPCPPMDEDGNVLYVKYHVDRIKMIEKFMSMSEYDLLLLTRMINNRADIEEDMI